jgi:hypothetical protein
MEKANQEERHLLPLWLEFVLAAFFIAAFAGAVGSLAR